MSTLAEKVAALEAERDELKAGWDQLHSELLMAEQALEEANMEALGYETLKAERDALKAQVARVEALLAEDFGAYKWDVIHNALHPEPTALELLERIEDKGKTYCGFDYDGIEEDLAALRRLLEEQGK